MRIQRNDDMHPAGEAVLRLTVQTDGDVIVALEAPDPVTGKPAYATVEFCAPGHGGGRSPRTHAALRALARAMATDNGNLPATISDPLEQLRSALRAIAENGGRAGWDGKSCAAFAQDVVRPNETKLSITPAVRGIRWQHASLCCQRPHKWGEVANVVSDDA